MKPKHYIRLTMHGHPRADAQGHVAEHVIIAERALGRALPPRAEVHHVDGTRTNNVNGNLVICQDRAYHKLLHVRTVVVRMGGHPDTHRLCSVCRSLKTWAEFHKNARNKATGLQTSCRTCQASYNKTYCHRRRFDLLEAA